MANKEKSTVTKDEIAAIKSLESSIEQFHTEINFGSNAFKGAIDLALDSMNNATKTIISKADDLNELFEDYQRNSKELNGQIATLSLLPTKTQEALKKLVPEVGKEVENIHDNRMANIESSLLELQKQFSEAVSSKQKALEKIASDNIEEIKKVQLCQIEQQEKMFRKVVYYTEKEIKSVTSNHGSKFIRNTAMCLILAVIAGATSGWYINRYMPKFVTLEKTGNITINHSNVRVLDKVKNNNNLNK